MEKLTLDKQSVKRLKWIDRRIKALCKAEWLMQQERNRLDAESKAILAKAKPIGA